MTYDPEKLRQMLLGSSGDENDKEEDTEDEKKDKESKPVEMKKPEKPEAEQASFDGKPTEIPKPEPSEETKEQSAIPEAGSASFADEADKPEPASSEKASKGATSDGSDLAERLRRSIEMSKAKRAEEEEKPVEPVERKAETVEPPAEKKTDSVERDAGKTEGPREVLERYRAEQAKKTADIPVSREPSPPEEEKKEEAKPPEEKPGLTSSADMLREHSRKMGMSREEIEPAKPEEIPVRQEPEPEKREPVGIAAHEAREERPKKQEDASPVKRAVASNEPKAESKGEEPKDPVEKPQIPDPEKTAGDNFAPLRQALQARERKPEEKSDEIETLRKAGGAERDKKPKKTKKPVKRIEVHPPSPLSLLVLIGAAISIAGATFALALDQTGLPILALGVIGLVLTGVFVGVNRHWLSVFLSSRGARYSANIVTVIASLLGILIFINIAAYKYPFRIDLSSEGLHSLSPQTIEMLEAINRAGETIAVTAFVPQKSGYREPIEKLMDLYLYNTSNLDFQFVDPDVKLELTESKGITRVPSVLFELGENRSIATEVDESHFTSALLAVRETHSRLVSFLAGHGEPDPFSAESDQSGLSKLKEQLELEGYEVNRLRIPEANGVPPETSLLIIANPTRDLEQQEIEAIERYLDNGGSLMVLLEPGKDAGLDGILTKYGVSLGENLVLDDQNNAYGEVTSPIVVGNPEHAISRSLSEGMVFYNATTFDYTTSGKLPNVTIDSLVRSSSSSWVENSGNKQFDENIETRDSSELAVLATRVLEPAEEESIEETDEQEEAPIEEESVETESTDDETQEQDGEDTSGDAKVAQVLAIGDTSFIRNASYDSYYNKDFALNAVNYLTARQDLISIRPNEPEDRQLNLSKAQRTIIFAFSVILTPLLIAALGGLVWWKRS